MRLKGGKLLLDLTQIGDISTLDVGSGTGNLELYDVLKPYIKGNYYLNIPKVLNVNVLYDGRILVVEPKIYDIVSNDATQYNFDIANRKFQIFFYTDEAAYKTIKGSIVRDE